MRVGTREEKETGKRGSGSNGKKGERKEVLSVPDSESFRSP